jgi:hypothetical protein
MPIAEATNAIDMTMYNRMKTFETWTFLMSKANEAGYGGYYTATAYLIQADHLPPHTPMNFPLPKVLLEMVAGAVRKSKSDIVLSTLAVSLYTE